MLWFGLSFISAVSTSFRDVFAKKGLKDFDEYQAAFWTIVFAFPFALFLVLFSGIPTLGSQFWFVLIVDGVLNAVANVLFMRAIRQSDISLSVPLISFTPLFLLLTSPILLGEFPTTVGLSGVILVVVGAYVLNIGEFQKGLLAPFQALLRERGPQLMLCVAFIWGITTNLDKIGVRNSSSMFWLVCMYGTILLVLLPVILFKSKSGIGQIREKAKSLSPIGFFTAVSDICQMIAITLTLVAYVISVKRVSSVITVFFGHFFFNEKGVRERLVGAAIMVLGVAIIAFS